MTAPAPHATDHVPVLIEAVLRALAPRDDGIYVDGTFGGGSYTRALLDAARCSVYGIDRDPRAIAAGRAVEARYGARLRLLHGHFAAMEALLARHDVHAVDGVALDLGVSSMQLDAPESGFSFQHDGPLDMRMDAAGTSAADILNGMGEAELADILFRYGEERRSRAIARAIVAARREAPITRTRQLAAIVARAAPKGAQAIHPATRTFQALRIYVNRELEELALGLGAAQALLKPGGRLAVVSFHSLEDRIVKRFLAERTGAAPRASRHAPGGAAEPDAGAAPSFRLLARGGETPDAAETAANPRARSARLRAAERTAGALRPVDPVALGVPRLAEKRGRP